MPGCPPSVRSGNGRSAPRSRRLRQGRRGGVGRRAVLRRRRPHRARLDRPELDQVRDAAAAARRIDAVVALCPDRLARNYVHQALVLEELARFGVSVIFLEGGHADDPHGRLLAQIQAAVAKFERTKIVDRNRRGKLWRARQGEVVSVPSPTATARSAPLPGSADRSRSARRRPPSCARPSTGTRTRDCRSGRLPSGSSRQESQPQGQADLASRDHRRALAPGSLRRHPLLQPPDHPRRCPPAPPALRRASAAHPDPAARGVVRHRGAAPRRPRHLVTFIAAASLARNGPIRAVLEDHGAFALNELLPFMPAARPGRQRSPPACSSSSSGRSRW
jgi:hypothetical protein